MCWYIKGLNFKCLQCAGCCGGFPGYVWLNDEEIEKISKFLQLSKAEFLKKYTRHVYSKISLKENLVNYDCVFLKNKKCTIYEVRPSQCKSFPFWEDNLKDEKSWLDLKKYCPGVESKDSHHFTLEEINKKMTP